MPGVPFIGRLSPWEYVALVGSLFLIGLESFLRVVTLALPGPIIRLLYRASQTSFNYLSSAEGRRSRNRKRNIVASIAQASDFTELCEIYGYYAEEHIVQTGDGYLLGLHRLGWKHGEEDQRVNSGKNSIRKKVAYLHHGLMMNSEVWACLTDEGRCLPFRLVEAGYDVWLGNNRGNKYSKKSVRHAPTESKFWNFSIDQFAFHDIPDSIDYILSTTDQPSLSYIGFSQGTAQAFATLSIHPNLNDKVDVFIALAPAMSPPGNTTIVGSFVKASPNILFLGLGRRAILSSATMWQALLYPPIFVRLIDLCLSFLFGWHVQNISAHQKLAAYPHLYSFTSTKSVVHWFQIIRNGIFQMYDDEVQAPLSVANGSKYYKVAKFPTRNIKTPIVLVYGGSDSLVDIKVMLKELPRHTVVKEIPKYEHLDFLWASDVDALVFPHVFDALNRHAGKGKDGAGSSAQRPWTPERIPTHLATFSDDENAQRSTPDSMKKISESVSPGQQQQHHQVSAAPSPPQTTTPAPDPASAANHPPSSPRPSTPLRQPKKPRFTTSTPPLSSPAASAHPSVSQAATDKTSTSRPEGWWSSDEVGGTETSTPAGSPVESRGQSPRRGSGSVGSVDGRKSFGARGIALGAGRAVEGVVDRGLAWGSGGEGGVEGGGRRRGKKRREG
ncbi:cholesterol esterase [Coniosporium apollinis]|uniref:Cholesterol esterase n=1 Tax=Coniosporium apollinis TaxID=61459 RepID=A0ABQ9NJK3_9PEZI|nr:cholesterol esterase [Coniosporium apollinis]